MADPVVDVARTLDRESLAILAGLRGQRWRCFGGPQVSGWLTDVSLVVATETSALTIGGEVEGLDFEGEEDSYSHLRIDRGAADHVAGAQSWRTFDCFAGEEVRDVLVVRETVDRSSGGRPAWRCTTDIAVVFVLRTGVLAVALVSHHSELLAAVRADDLQGLAIEEPGGIWTGRPGAGYGFGRATVPVRVLLDAAPRDGGSPSSTAP